MTLDRSKHEWSLHGYRLESHDKAIARGTNPVRALCNDNPDDPHPEDPQSIWYCSIDKIFSLLGLSLSPMDSSPTFITHHRISDFALPNAVLTVEWKSDGDWDHWTGHPEWSSQVQSFWLTWPIPNPSPSTGTTD